MKVILLRDIRGLGRKNEIREAKDGFIRHVLLPKKLVQIATTETIQKLQTAIKKSQAEKEKFLSQLQSSAESLKEIVLEFPVRANAQGEIFGSISAKDIEKSLSQKEFKTAIAILEKPIKRIGEYQIEINLGKKVQTTIKIKVIARP